VSDLDRRLVFLIEELTDCGMVFSLESVVDLWGRDRTARVINDGFAVVRNSPDAWRGDSGLSDDNFLPVEDAVVLIHHLKKTDDYLILEGPWAPICPESELDLILRYAADDSAAVAEIRKRHAERRGTWERMRVST
jgi:hypothetical protein